MTVLQRILPLANGGLLEVRMGASQRSGVDFMFAAVIQEIRMN